MHGASARRSNRVRRLRPGRHGRSGLRTPFVSSSTGPCGAICVLELTEWSACGTSPSPCAEPVLSAAEGRHPRPASGARGNNAAGAQGWQATCESPGQRPMKNKLAYPLILGLLVAACGNDRGRRNAAGYETVQEGSASGVTSTIHGPGEVLPPITDTNADTTSAFTLDPNAVPPPTQLSPQPAPTQPPATQPPPQREHAPPPPTDTAPPPTNTAPPADEPPPPAEEPEEEEEEPPPPPTTTDTRGQLADRA